MVCPDRAFGARAVSVATLALLACSIAMVPGAAVAEGFDALGLATRLAGEPRVPGSSAHGEAVEILREQLEIAGLVEVVALALEGEPKVLLVTGVLPGESGHEILLTAHFDTVAGSPGAADNAAGCAVVLAAVTQLVEVPRNHAVRVLFFDGEESGLLGSRRWVEALTEAQRSAVLAAVNIDMLAWDEELRGAVLPLLSRGGDRPRVAPGWLVHAAVESAAAVGAPLSVASSVASVPAQILMRSVRLDWAADADVLLGHGVPALTLSDVELFSIDPAHHSAEDTAERLSLGALERWTLRTTALIRRLDALAGRPRDDDQYLVVFGRVFSRRALYWVGLTVWILWVFRALPGRWRATGASERRRRGRGYLPGFALRFVLLGCILMLPTFAIVLLLPAAVLGLLPARWRLSSRVETALALVPAVVMLGGLVVLLGRGLVTGVALGPVAILLLGGCLAGQLIWRRAVPADAVAPPGDSRLGSRLGS